MWWIIFTAIDLYIGLIVLDVIARSFPAEKQRRAAVAKKVIIVLLVLLGAALAGMLIRRNISV